MTENEMVGSFRMDWLDLLAVQAQESSPTPQFKSINSSALSLLHSPTLTSIHDQWKTIALTRRSFVARQPGFCRGQQEVSKRWKTAVQRS